MELIKTIEKERNSFPLLKAIYSNDLLPKFCIKEKGKITEYLVNNEAYVYLDKSDELTYEYIYEFAKSLTLQCPRNYQIDLSSFVTKNLSINEVIDAFVKGINFEAYKIS